MYFYIKFLLLEAKQLKFYNAHPLMSDFGRFIPLCPLQYDVTITY